MFKKIAALSIFSLFAFCSQDTKPVKKNVLDPYIHIKPLQSIIAGYINQWTEIQSIKGSYDDRSSSPLKFVNNEVYSKDNWQNASLFAWPGLESIISKNRQYEVRGLQETGELEIRKSSLRSVDPCIIHTFKAHDIYRDRSIWAIAFTFDDSCLISAGRDRGIKIWNLETGTIKHRIYMTDQIFSIAHSPCGKYIVVAGVEGIIRFINGQTYKCEKGLSLELDGVNSIKIDRLKSTLMAFWDKKGIFGVKTFEKPTELEYDESN